MPAVRTAHDHHVRHDNLAFGVADLRARFRIERLDQRNSGVGVGGRGTDQFGQRLDVAQREHVEMIGDNQDGAFDDFGAQ